MEGKKRNIRTNYDGFQTPTRLTLTNVQIFNTYITLRGHTTKVRSIIWMHLDSKLMTVGQEGSVYFWEAFTGSRVAQTVTLE